MHLVLETAWPMLHISPEHWKVLRPEESHKLFGAGFLFVGALMAAEMLAGGVWQRTRIRMLIFRPCLSFSVGACSP